MTPFIKKLLSTFLVIFSLSSMRAQDGPLDSRYLVSLHYLTTNNEVVDEIKKAFPYLVKKKDKNFQFNLSSQIEFILLDNFTIKLDENKNEETLLDLTNISSNKSKYYFEPFHEEKLNNIIPESDSRMLLTFSKPIRNLLIAEILDSRLNISQIKMGPALQILFVFSNQGIVEDVFYTFPYYN